MLDSDDNVYLVGLMGVGKTTLGKKLAKRLGCVFVDTDQEIERSTGVTINHIFDIEGESGFRQRESQILEQLSEKPGQVIATGGGIITQAVNRELLKNAGVTIYLHAPVTLLWSRLRHCKNRPLLQKDQPKKVLADLLKQREPFYREVADHVIHASSGSANKTIHRIVQLLNKS